MKTLLHVKLFALAVAGLIVFATLSKLTAPLAHATQVASAHAETIARVVVTGKRMSAREKVEYDTKFLAQAASGMPNTASR
jgi:hypothetical protein